MNQFQITIIEFITLFLFLASCTNFDAEKIGKKFMQQYETNGVLFLQDTSFFTIRCIEDFSKNSRYTNNFKNLYTHFTKESNTYEFDYLFVKEDILKNKTTDEIFPFYFVSIENKKKNKFHLHVIEINGTYYINSFYFPRH